MGGGADIADEGLAFLAALVETPGVPGREDAVRELIRARAEARGLFDDLRVDALGSLIGTRRPRPATGAAERPVRVLLSAHMDQVGFLVSHVSEAGKLRLHPVGSFDVRTLVSQRVCVHAEDGTRLTGLLVPDGHPVHTASGEDARRQRKLSDFHVDLGGPSGAPEAVRPGDMVVFDTPFADLGHSVAGPGLDNRLGCWALFTALEGLAHHGCEIVAVWSAQEELGSRGIEPVGFATRVDLAISCDTVAACDVPGVPSEQAVCRLGDGVALVVADSSILSDMDLVRRIERLAAAGGIGVQRCLMEGGGQDGAMIQRSREGVRTAVMSCPVRHMHTPNELASKADLASYVAALRSFLQEI